MATSSQISTMYAQKRLGHRSGGGSGPDVPPNYDSLFGTTPYAGTVNVDGAINVGTRFQRVGTGTLTLYGAKWWRPARAMGSPRLCHCAAGAGTATSTKVSTAADVTTAGWETVLFDTPVTISSSAVQVVWMNLPTGGYAATNNGLQTGVASQQGLFSASVASTPGVFAQPPGSATTEPAASFQNSYYWVDPLITGAGAGLLMLESITPPEGPSGSQVNLQGSFPPGAVVLADGTPVQHQGTTTSEEITVVVDPARPPGTYTVTVQDPQTSAESNAKDFTVTPVFTTWTPAYYGHEGAGYTLNKLIAGDGNVIVVLYGAGKAPLPNLPSDAGSALTPAAVGLSWADVNAAGATQVAVSSPITQSGPPGSWTAAGTPVTWLYEEWYPAFGAPSLVCSLLDAGGATVHAFAPIPLTT